MTAFPKRRLVLLAYAALLIGGCTTAPTTEEHVPSASTQAPPGDVPPDFTTPQEPHRLDPRERAVATLVARADLARGNGQFDTAVANIERALRIAPRDPQLWQRLASVRLEQGKFYLAEQLASKSNAVAGQDNAMRARNWEIIAQSRELRGDTAGARLAYDRAAGLSASGPSQLFRLSD